MSTRCTICRHVAVTAIDDDLNGGAPMLRVARQRSVSYHSLRRHVDGGHVRKPISSDVPANGESSLPELPDGATPRDSLVALIRRIEREAAGGTLRSDMARELRLAYTALDGMTGGDAPTEVALHDVPGLAEFVGEVDAALEPFPDARRAYSAIAQRYDF